MGRIGGRAEIEVDAPIEQVWKLVEDVESAPDWQGGLISVEALEHDKEGRPTLCESVSETPVKKVTTEVRFSYQPPTKLSWEQEKGDMKSLDGAWELEELDGGRTRVAYVLDADPGRMLGMLIRGPVEGQIRKMLVDSRPGELKEQLEQR